MNIKKLLPISLVCISIFNIAKAQETEETKQKQSSKKSSVEIDFNIGKDDSSEDKTEKVIKYPRSFGGITFSRLD